METAARSTNGAKRRQSLSEEIKAKIKPNLKNVERLGEHTHRADGRGVSTLRIRLKAKTIAKEMRTEG